MRPVHRPGAPSVLHRIVMDVIHMRDVIIMVGNRVLPGPPLPDAAFALADATDGSCFARLDGPAEFSFDCRPARRKVMIAARQCPDAMQMFRQNNNGVNAKWPSYQRHPKSPAKRFDALDEQRPVPIKKIDGEEVRSAGNPPATIARHGGWYRREPYAAVVAQHGGMRFQSSAYPTLPCSVAGRPLWRVQPVSDD